MVTLSISLISLVWVQTKSYYSKIEASSTLKDIKRKLFIAPIFFLKNTFVLGTIVLIGVMNPWVCLINLGSYIVTMTSLYGAWIYITGGKTGKQ